MLQESRISVIKVGEKLKSWEYETQKNLFVPGLKCLKTFNSGEAGDNIGALLRGVERDDVEGRVLCKPGSITPHTEFECQAYILKKEGRHTHFH